MILLLLARRKNVTAEAFESALEGALPAGAELATVMPGDALPALAHAADAAADLPDALVTLDQSDTLDFLANIDAVLDRAASSVLAVERHAILPGRAPVRLFFGLRRLERLTHAGFCDYWLNRHAQIGRRLIPPYTYHQMHGQEALTAIAAQITGLAASTFDGVVEVHFPDVDAFVRQLSRKDVAAEALEDEKNFIDHARSRFWAYRERA